MFEFIYDYHSRIVSVFTAVLPQGLEIIDIHVGIQAGALRTVFSGICTVHDEIPKCFAISY